MAEFKISIDVPDSLLPHLQEMAEARGLDGIPALLGALTLDQIARLQARLKDPVVGAIRSGQSDLAAHDEDVLRAEWDPD